ncbi:MAG: formyltransferase family protein [Erysipelotrichaceae bacterium]|nr:formyltransferase family protein [Erysipelotrichaceae bacterium]
MKTILIGAVTTTRRVLETMVEVNFPISYVFSLDDAVSENVSDYDPVFETAEKFNVPYKKFKKINDEENVKIIKEIDPDYIFVIGLSQLVKDEIINAARKGVVGFHPAPLPKYRGRATNVWQQLLGVKESAVSVFFIDDGIDSGDILAQEPYYIGENDYCQDVLDKIDEAAIIAMRKVLIGLRDNTLMPVKQNDEEATYTLKRSPEDGLIDWNQSIRDIHLLIRAISRPYPGAFSMYDGKSKIVIYKAEVLENKKYIGFNGQIAELRKDGFDVVCKDGLLRVTDYENVDNVKMFVGHRFRG